MRALTQNKTILLLAAACALFAGCAEQEAPSVKKSRLIAAENKKLLQELDEQGRRIVELKANHAKELADQKDLLDKCHTERDALKEKVQGQIETQVEGVLQSVMDQNKLLRDQVEQLQAELKALKDKPDAK